MELVAAAAARRLLASPVVAFALARPLLSIGLAVFGVEFVNLIPGWYHVRCLSVYLYEIYWRRARGRIGATIDAPVIVRGQRIRLGDLDFNFHMNNAVYALIADHARFHWYNLFFSNAGSPAAFERMHIAVGHVSTVFYREMRWLQRFRTETRCVGFDGKWCFVEVRFVSEDRPRAGEAAPTLHAVTLARICFKEKRGEAKGKTIAPAEALAFLEFVVPPGLLKSSGCEAGALLVRTAALLQSSPAAGGAAGKAD